MGRLSHLLTDVPTSQTFQLDLGGQIGDALSAVVTRALEDKLAPIIDDMIKNLESVDNSVESSDKATAASMEKLASTVEEVIDEAGSAMARELAGMRGAIKGSNKALQDALSKGDNEFRKNLLAAFSRIQIPDYSSELAQIKALLEREDDEEDDEPKEWDFTVVRNRNGYIQSVTAKAK